MKRLTIQDFKKWGAIGGKKSRRVLSSEEATRIAKIRWGKIKVLPNPCVSR